MRLTYSKVIKSSIGFQNLGGQKLTRVRSRVDKEGTVLDKSIHLYRMWFLFLKLGLDCEDNKIPIYDWVNKKNIWVKVKKRFYKEWDLDDVRHLTFNNWWKKKKHLFLESEPKIVSQSDTSKGVYYIKVDERQKTSDVVRGVRKLLKEKDNRHRKSKPTSKYQIVKQHKYIPTHMKYNLFIWREMGYKRRELVDLLEKEYSGFNKGKDYEESSIRRLLRLSERLILDTSDGRF